MDLRTRTPSASTPASHWYNNISVRSPMATSQQYHSNEISPLNWRQSLGRTLAADSRNPLSLKCNEVEKICTSLSNKELVEAFPYLLNDIFQYNNATGWGLDKLEPRRYPTDYHAVHQFLSPNGCLFKFIDRLMNDHEAMFQFPLSSFPIGVMELIEKGAVPMLYANKISTININGVAHFNAFEYYFVLFSYYVSQQQTSKPTSNWSAVEDCLYIQLLEDYLRHFFPMSVLTPTQRNVKFNDNTNTITKYTKPTSKFSLWKPEVETNQRTNTWTSYNSTESFTDPGRSEVLLQILTDFWLCINRQNSNGHTNTKLPSIDHARVVRVLVKYFHTYINCIQEKQPDTFASPNYHGNETRRTFVPLVLHQKLYFYLKDCFTHWSLDGSFRMVLETWLSFIQPWRYTSMELSLNESTSPADINQWRRFVEENNVFYNELFRMFLFRSMRLEMKSPLSMQLVYRVAKVFSQSNLAAVLKDVLSNDSPLNPKRRSPSSTPYNTMTPMYAGIRNKTSLTGIEDVDNMFDDETTQLVHTLCESLATTCIELKRDLYKTNKSQTDAGGKGFWARVSDFFMLDEAFYDRKENDHEERLIEYLEQSSYLFSLIYQFPAFNTKLLVGDQADGDTSFKDPPSESLLHPNDDGVTPEFRMTEDGVKLTARGREQILRRLRHFEFCDSDDPEFRAVANYESKYLVVTLYRLASRLNEKYSHQLHTLYNRNDVISNTFRKLSKEVENTRFLNCSIKIPRQRVDLTEVKPRISLRFGASYYFLGYMFWAVVFARLFGFSWFTIISVFLIGIIVAVVVHIDSPPKVMVDES